MAEDEYLSLKQARMIEAVARTRSIADASTALGSTQSVVSRTIAAAERALGRTIFQRGWGGSEPTAWGETVLRRCTSTLRLLAQAEDRLTQAGRPRANLTAFLRWHHLDAVSAVVHSGSTTSAADMLGLTQPAISRSIAALTDIVHQPIFIRKRTGLEPTTAARTLAQLRNALRRELGSITDMTRIENTKGLSGRLAVGLLPFSGQDLVARVFGKLTNEHPNLRLVAVPGIYDMLADALVRGEIDCMIGILRHPPRHQRLEEQFLFHERYTLVARHDHPCHQRQLTMADLHDERWIVARHGTPVRTYFETLFENEGTSPPAQTCEIGSQVSVEDVLTHSNSIALLCYGERNLKDLRPDVRRLDIELPGSQVDIGLTTRKGEQIESVGVFEQSLRDLL